MNHFHMNSKPRGGGGKGGKPQRDKNEMTVVIDCMGKEFQDNEILDFLHQQVSKREQITPTPQKTTKINNILYALYSNIKETNAMIQLNGITYQDTKLFISNINFTKLKDELDKITTYFKTHYHRENQSIDLSDLRGNKVALNLNYVHDMEFGMFYLGALTRQNRIPVKIINLSNNNIHHLNGMDQVRVYFPFLATIILSNNPVEDESEISKFLSGYDVQLTPSTSAPAQNKPPINFAQQTQPEPVFNVEEDEAQEIPDIMKHSIDMTPKIPDLPVFEDSRINDIKPLIDHIISTSKTNIGMLESIYDQNAVFSLTFPTASGNSPLKKLFSMNRNLTFPKCHSVQVFTTPKVIVSNLSKNFPQGLDCQVEQQKFVVIKDQFFAGTVHGKLILEGHNFRFSRSLLIIGKDGKLLVLNDHLGINYFNTVPTK